MFGKVAVNGWKANVTWLSVFVQPLKVAAEMAGGVEPAALAPHEPTKKFELFEPSVSAFTATVSAGLLDVMVPVKPLIWSTV